MRRPELSSRLDGFRFISPCFHSHSVGLIGPVHDGVRLGVLQSRIGFKPKNLNAVTQTRRLLSGWIYIFQERGGWGDQTVAITSGAWRWGS